jgi:hypothetical protein
LPGTWGVATRVKRAGQGLRALPGTSCLVTHTLLPPSSLRCCLQLAYWFENQQKGLRHAQHPPDREARLNEVLTMLGKARR